MALPIFTPDDDCQVLAERCAPPVDDGDIPQPAWSLYTGNCRDWLRLRDDDSVDAVVTDPPYGLSEDLDLVAALSAWLRGEEYRHRRAGFLGQEWDSLVPGPDVWREVLRVLRPGGYLLAFAGTRTWDLMSVCLRLGGFLNRDTVRHDFGVPALGWVQGEGFPKARSQLKPSWEPILVFRKPGPVVDLRVDDCRVGETERYNPPASGGFSGGWGSDGPGTTARGRWPANLCLSHGPACGLQPEGSWSCEPGCPVSILESQQPSKEQFFHHFDPDPFFYQAKARRSDGNPHSTVKPEPLMRHLCRLVAPVGGVVLDPFTGSGTTGVAALREGMRFVGCERDPGYADFARRRLSAIAMDD